MRLLFHLFEIGLAHREIRVAALPLEVGVIATAFLHSEVRDALQFLHPFGLRDGASESREQMDVVFHAADEEGRAIELFGDAAEIRMERVARGFVAQERAAVFGGEEQKADFKAESTAANSKHAPMEIPHGVRQFDPKRPLNLGYTRVRGEFGATPFSKWNDLLRIDHIHAFKKAGSFEELHKVTRAPIRNGSHSDDGYRFISQIGISIQGKDSGYAWDYALRLAIHLKVPVKAEIEWRNNDKAAYPGERGIMVWTP